MNCYLDVMKQLNTHLVPSVLSGILDLQIEAQCYRYSKGPLFALKGACAYICARIHVLASDRETPFFSDVRGRNSTTSGKSHEFLSIVRRVSNR